MTNPLLSIVTGTYNRLDYLRGMVESARRQMFIGLDYEVVIVDGGSTDGTQAWCKAQPDIRLIEHGALYGAIKAFCDGARAASGDYVLLANDDILFHDGAIVKALTYLNSHLTCGAVAFMDNRKAPGYMEEGYHVQYVGGTSPDGRSVSIPYAQVGLYRRWLGDFAGWWGDTDEIMKESRTYGGDNFLSARIWELGYTVDAVEGCAVDDRIPMDDLRAQNVAHDANIPSPYHRRYPSGVLIGSLPKPPNPQAEKLRILYLPLFSPGYGRYKTGLYEALSKVGWCYELDYIAKPSQFMKAIRLFQPHIVLTQFHGANVITPDTLDAARRLIPEALFINWNGDVYVDQLTAPEMLELLKRFDLQLVVNADVMPIYQEHGIKSDYWQIGFEPVSDKLPPMPAHDILFMANAYSPARKELGAVLKELSHNVGIYGTGWGELGSGNTFYRFDEGASLYRHCKIAIGDNQYGSRGFVSNRLFEALSNGAFLLHQTIPGLEPLTGLIDGVHYVGWSDYEDLAAKARSYLLNDEARREIAAAGESFVRRFHSFDARVRELFEELIPRMDNNGKADDGLDALADRALAGEWRGGIPR